MRNFPRAVWSTVSGQFAGLSLACLDLSMLSKRWLVLCSVFSKVLAFTTLLLGTSGSSSLVGLSFFACGVESQLLFASLLLDFSAMEDIKA